MLKTQMGHTNSQDTVFGTIGTVILYFIARQTLSDLATIATIFAGVGTGALAIFRLVIEIKKWQRKSK